MAERKLDKDRVKSIVDRLLFSPPMARESLPSFLLGRTSTLAFLTDDYFICVILTRQKADTARELMRKGLDPFPGLIKPEGVSAPCAFRLEKSRNGLFDNNTVTNMYSFSLGKDNTVVIQNHFQSIKTKEHGQYDYIIDLAYLISFGDEINFFNFYNYFEDLVAFSLKQWRG